MSSVITKPLQKADYVVRAGTRAIYRGDNAVAARAVAKSRSNSTITFRNDATLNAYLKQR